MKLTDFVPDLYHKSIYNINFQELKEAGITSIITDLDNTLVEANSPECTPQLTSWLENLKEEGFKVIILSNNNKIRVEEFAKPFSLPFIHRAMKPFNGSFKKALKILGSSANETVVIGDQLVTDIFGGKRMGLYTILVEPISIKENKTTKINRKIESIILPLLKKRGLFIREE